METLPPAAGATVAELSQEIAGTPRTGYDPLYIGVSATNIAFQAENASSILVTRSNQALWALPGQIPALATAAGRRGLRLLPPFARSAVAELSQGGAVRTVSSGSLGLARARSLQPGDDVIAACGS